MTTITYIFGAILIACALFLIVSVLVQNSGKTGLSGAIAGGGNTFLNKNKAKSSGKKLTRMTVIASIVFVVVALATYLVG